MLSFIAQTFFLSENRTPALQSENCQLIMTSISEPIRICMFVTLDILHSSTITPRLNLHPQSISRHEITASPACRLAFKTRQLRSRYLGYVMVRRTRRHRVPLRVTKTCRGSNPQQSPPRSLMAKLLSLMFEKSKHNFRGVSHVIKEED